MSAYAPEEQSIHHGKSIGYADTANGSFTAITGTNDIGFPDAELSTAETTNDSTPDQMKDYIPGLTEPGKISFSYKYGKTQFAALDTLYQLAYATGTRASATKFWKITLPDGSSGVVKGFMTKHTLPSGDGEDVLSCDVEIQCRSKLVFTAATGS